MKMQVMKLYYLNILVIPPEILKSRNRLKDLVNIMFYLYQKFCRLIRNFGKKRDIL